MKALKITVVALLIVIAGLLFTIRRLARQAVPEGAPTPVSAGAPAAAPPAAQAPPAAVPAPEAAASPKVAEPEKPSPVLAKKQVTRARTTAASSEPAPVPAVQTTPPPAPAPKPAEAPVATASTPPATPVPETPKAPAQPPAPRRVTIPAGTILVVRTQNTLSTERNLKGDTFAVTLQEPLVADGYVIAEKGAEVEGVVTRSEKAGRVEGVSELVVELVRLHTLDGQRVSIATELHEVRGERSRGSDAKKVGVATGIGAIIGAIAGGGKGAAIGAGAGAGAGTGAVLATRGKPSVVPSESVLSFHLKTPVEVTERR